MLCHRSSVSSVVKFFVTPLLVIASCCSAEEVTIIVTGLDAPTAVAVVDEKVFYADAAGLHALDVTPLIAINSPIHSLAILDANHLIVSSDEVRLWSLAEDSPELELKQTVRVIDEDESNPFTSLVADGRHMFATRAGRVYRSRRAGQSLTSLRAFGTSWANDIAALALSEHGYLVLLQAKKKDWRLVFCDPYMPEGEPIASWSVPLTEPIALAYSPLPSPTERRLYVLTADGLYRLDAAVGDTISVTKIADIPHGVAMAFALDGTLYVATQTKEGAGVLLRVNGPL